MDDLTFGEQVKIVLKRKNMTIKELAALIEEKTERKMSRQNLTQRLGRDNFQEQDMRLIAEILGCPFQLSIFENEMPQKSVTKIPKITQSVKEKYDTNTVRKHPEKEGYVQMYDADSQSWNDMTERTFVTYQEQKKKLLGKDYEAPVYIDRGLELE